MPAISRLLLPPAPATQPTHTSSTVSLTVSNSASHLQPDDCFYLCTVNAGATVNLSSGDVSREQPCLPMEKRWREPLKRVRMTMVQPLPVQRLPP